MANCSVIYIQGIEDIDSTIKFNGQEISLLQVLTSLRTRTSWDTPIFTQVHFSDSHDEYIGICHNNERVEALKISRNIVTLCIARFGDDARTWFHNWAIEKSASVRFDFDTKKIVDKEECDYGHLILDTGDQLSDAQAQAIIKERGRDGLLAELERFKEEYESDDDDEKMEVEEETNNQEEYVFELDFLFNLEPPHSREGPHRCDESLATHATGASKATLNLNRLNDTVRQTGDDENG